MNHYNHQDLFSRSDSPLSCLRTQQNNRSSMSLRSIGKPLGMAIALMLTATACQSSPDSSSSANGLKIGSLLPITGDLAQYGGPMQDAASLLVDRKAHV